MKQFVPITKPIEVDFYSVFENNGIKYIHIFGYSYESSYEEFVTDDNPNGTYWANMECSWFTEPLADFIKNLKANENYVDETYEVLNQYQGDYTAEKMVELINHYFDGKPADHYLPFEELTEDTPCGNYVREF